MTNKNLILITIFSMFLFLMMVMGANATITNCGLMVPTNNSAQYDNGVITLNATATWAIAGANVTNVTFVLTSGSTTFKFANNTVNGTAGVGGTNGYFTYKLSSSSLTPNLIYTAFATCRNDSDEQSPASAVNSSSVTYTVDTINPSILLNRPQKGQSLTPNNGYIKFEYTPTETNLGNCTLYLGGLSQKSSTSGTTSPNVSTGSVNSFQNAFGGNNASLSWNVECVDLAGNRANASEYTLSVLTSGYSNIVDASGGVSSGNEPVYVSPTGEKTLSAGNTGTESSGSFGQIVQDYGWVGILAIVVLLGYMLFKKKWK